MMSKSALESLQNARKRQTLPVYGETLAATVGTDGIVPSLITRQEIMLNYLHHMYILIKQFTIETFALIIQQHQFSRRFNIPKTISGTHYRNACFRHAAAHVLSPPLCPDPDTPQAMVEALAE